MGEFGSRSAVRDGSSDATGKLLKLRHEGVCSMSKGVITLNAALPQSPDALTVDVAGAAKLLAISVSIFTL